MKHTPSIPFPVRPNIFPVWISLRWCRPLLFSPKAKMVMALLPALVGCAESMKHAETGGPPAGLQKHPLQARPAGNRGLGEGGGLRPWGKRVSSRRGACDWFPGCLPHLRRPVHFTPLRGGPLRCLLFRSLWAGERARFRCRIRETSSCYRCEAKEWSQHSPAAF